MNAMIAEAIVRSLVGRLTELPSGFRLPESLLSNDEVNALKFLSKCDVREIFVNGSGGGKSTTKQVELKLDSCRRSGPSEESLRLCLDFGTALSKAWAMGKDVHEAIPLVLGRYSGLGEVAAVPSSVFISISGRIFFGGNAETQHRQEIEQGRKRFDNLKRMFSDLEVNQDLDHVMLPSGVDPTESGLTKGNLLLLYLAWLTDQAHRALDDFRRSGGIPIEELVDADIRSIKRRYAIPCFSEAQGTDVGGDERSVWAEGVLSQAILRAQIVADTLHDEWESLDTVRAKTVIDAVCELEPAELPVVLADEASVREPIAAGASLFDEELEELEEQMSDGSDVAEKRPYLMVIDAGAGTTDFAMFQVFPELESSGRRYALLSSSVCMSRVAGNAVDEALRPVILRACGIDPGTGDPRSDEDFAMIKADLAAQIREIKERLFRDGTCSVEFNPNARGTLERSDIMLDRKYVELVDEFNSQTQSILGSFLPMEFSDRLRWSGYRVPVYVLLTGGSSRLPFVKAIADSSITVDGIMFELKRIRSLPAWVHKLPKDVADLMGETFPQSAVSIGGSAPELPTELSARSEPIVPPPGGTRTLEKYATRGK